MPDEGCGGHTDKQPLPSASPRPSAPPGRETDSAVLFRAIANFTYDWETWAGLDGKPLWINPAVERITGYSVEDCLSMPDYPLPIVHEDDRAELARRLLDAKSGGSGNDAEFRIRRKDGRISWGAVSWQSIRDAAGGALGYRTSVRDITERKAVEEALRQAHREAERANLAKSRFLAAASHDLRQPIQAATMFASALKSTKSAARRGQIIASLEESLRATDDLLTALLDVSKLDAGVLQPRLHNFPVGDVLERMEIEFAALAEDKGLRFRLVHSSALLRSDPVLLERMLGNLVSNAVRYTETGGVLIGCRRQGELLRIEVWDSGIGIAAEDQQVIFEEFHQVGNPERDRMRGLGLGLAIVDRLSKLLGHRIRLQSAPEQGSRFAIEVPLASAADAADEWPSPVPADGHLAGRLVLAIDDDSVQLAALRAVFSHWGCGIICADSIETALAQLAQRSETPDAALVDYRLRDGKTGADAIARLQDTIGREVPALFLTGDTEPARLAQASASGVEILHKPVRPETLYRKLCALLPDGTT